MTRYVVPQRRRRTVVSAQASTVANDAITALSQTRQAASSNDVIEAARRIAVENAEAMRRLA